jgi:hypothetical protein
VLSRFAGRLLTSALAHFVAGLIDWLALAARMARARASGRDPWQ